jgi:hypothetical protein
MGSCRTESHATTDQGGRERQNRAGSCAFTRLAAEASPQPWAPMRSPRPACRVMPAPGTRAGEALNDLLLLRLCQIREEYSGAVLR